MAQITVDGKTVEWPSETRLVNAISAMGVPIGHRCGGQARCTTCRVRFVSGEPDTITHAEYAKLTERGLYGEYRLSCQILCEHDMTVEAQMTLDNQPDWGDTGPQPADTVQPVAEWVSKAEAAQS